MKNYQTLNSKITKKINNLLTYLKETNSNSKKKIKDQIIAQISSN